jgi:EPS-associated MarR family transcriptional regulator
MPPTQRLAGFQEEIQFEVLRRLGQSPDLSQRILAKELGISVGSINFCFQALVEKGWIKMQNFSNHRNKLGYVYPLMPKGLVEKSALTAPLLKRKLDEYERLKEEIEWLKLEVSKPESEAKNTGCRA